MNDKTSKKYSRISRIYDFLEFPAELLVFKKLRREAIYLARGKILEVGVGTGKNLPYYNRDADLTAIDFSSGMIKQAEKRQQQIGLENLKLKEMDVQNLPFEDNTFDTVISTFVFCTVPFPIKGLKELRRVLKPNGRAIFLEHMKSKHHLINLFLFLMNLVSVPLLGTSMLRKTQEYIHIAGFRIIYVENSMFDVVRLLIAKK